MAIVKGKQDKPKKVVIYGPEGIGKSTFASKFPNPVFIDTEGSTKYLDVARFDKTESWQDILAQVDEAAQDVSIETVVIDTADWAEMYCSKYVCELKGVKNIEDIGYGKGYVYLQEEFKKLLDKLEALTNQGMHVVMTAHAQMRKFEQPDEMGAYDRWEMKLSRKVAPMLKEWADMLLFANYQTFVVEDNKTKSKKATGGSRVMYSSHHPCWDAKNRFGLPDKMDFTFDAIKDVLGPDTSSKPIRKQPEKKTEPELVKPVQEDKPDEIPFEDEQPAQEEQPLTAYQELKKLMVQAKITDDEVAAACSGKNLQPANLKLANYPEDFIRKMLIAQFNGFAKYIEKNIKDNPYIEHYPKTTPKKKEEK